MSDELVYYWKNGKLLCFKPKTVTERLQKKFSQVHFKLYDLTTDEYLDYKREFDYSKKLKTVTNVTQSELDELTNALNLEISEEDSKRAIVIKYYGNYEYTVVNNRDYTYRVVKKKMIKSVYDERYGSKRTDKNRK